MRYCLAFCTVGLVLVLCTISWAAPFTVVLLPDTQLYSQSFPSTFRAQTQWIVDNRATQNIVMVSHVGDIVQNGGESPTDNLAEWNVAHAAMAILDASAPDLPYSLVVGNHDLGRVGDQSSAGQYTNFFGSHRFAGRPWYGGSSPDERNHYQLFSAEGRTYLHISLEWLPPASSLAWARGILDSNPTIPTILSTHEYTLTSGARSAIGNTIFNNLVSGNSQVFMTLSGHVSGEGHQSATNGAGEAVFEMLADYQGRPHGGDGWMQLIEFDEAVSQIKVRTFSPLLNEFESDGNSQFSFSVDFDSRFGPAIPESSGLFLMSIGLLACCAKYRPILKD